MLQKYKKLSLVAKASLWAFFSGLVQKGISILATPIFTRILSTEEFGFYTLYQSWSDIVIIFSTLNVFNYAIYSGLKEFENDADSFVSSAQLLITILSLIAFVIYYIFHIFYGDFIGFPLSIIIIMILDCLFFASFNIWAGKERYFFRYKLLTIISVIMGVLSPILGFIAIRYLSSINYSHIGYGRIYAVATVNIMIGLTIYIYNFIKSKSKIKIKYIKFLLIYCIPLLPHFLASKILVSFDRIMINNLCGTAEAGIYGLAYSLATITILISDSILKSLTPWTYQVIKNKTNFKSLSKNVNYLITFVAVVNLLLILFAPEVIKIFAPHDYANAIYIIPSVSASVYYMFLFNVFANIEYYYNETKYVAVASIGAAVTNIILNLIFIKQFGYIAAGYTTLVSYILYAIGHFIFMKKICKKHAEGMNYYDNKTILIISIIFTIVALLIIPLYNYFVIRYIFITVVFMLIFINNKKIINIFKNKQ